MVGWRGRGRVVVMAAVLVVLALLGLEGPTAAGAGDDATAIVGDAVGPEAPALTGVGDAQRGLARTVRAVPVPSEEGLLAAAAAALVVGWWVLVRGDGWGARPAAASPLAARRGPPASA